MRHHRWLQMELRDRASAGIRGSLFEEMKREVLDEVRKELAAEVRAETTEQPVPLRTAPEERTDEDGAHKKPDASDAQGEEEDFPDDFELGIEPGVLLVAVYHNVLTACFRSYGTLYAASFCWIAEHCSG